MDQILLKKFIQLVSDRIGGYIRPKDYASFSQKIQSRIRALNLSSSEDYYTLLQANLQASQMEWNQLIPLLTTAESYFFRDAGQFKLLGQTILPEIIDRRKLTKTMRIWSAGCSTGEEPYSLSILLQQLLPNWQQWQILIMGTDINPLVLEKAQAGIYNSWSFRGVDPDIQAQYFHPYGDSWKINPKVQNSVKFSKFNLIGDAFSQAHLLQDLDLILCRNVLIYFDKNYINQVICKFHQVLCPEGYLITGHAEIQQLVNNPFKIVVFPESVIYQREPSSASSIPPKSDIIQSSFQPISPPGTESFLATHSLSPATESRFIDQLVQQKRYAEAIQAADQVIKNNSDNFEIHCLLAEVHANLGQYSQANFHCEKALQINSFSILPWYLMLNIADETGDMEKAKTLAQRIIYLAGFSSSAILAYTKMAAILEQEDNFEKALKLYKTALELLRKLPNTSQVEYAGEITVAELTASIETIINS
ncbi:MAG: CheR family methyltransferase [Microcoleaceae cyanobacterium]